MSDSLSKILLTVLILTTSCIVKAQEQITYTVVDVISIDVDGKKLDINNELGTMLGATILITEFKNTALFRSEPNDKPLVLNKYDDSLNIRKYSAIEGTMKWVLEVTSIPWGNKIKLSMKSNKPTNKKSLIMVGEEI